MSTGGISTDALTSMSALSSASTFGIEALILIVRVSLETPVQHTARCRVSSGSGTGTGSPGADPSSLAPIHLVNVQPDDEVVDRSDLHEHVVRVVEITWNHVAHHHDPVNWR